MFNKVTHRISHSATTCLSTTCLSFAGSPSNCCRSLSPNREPRPIICLFLPYITEKTLYYTSHSAVLQPLTKQERLQKKVSASLKQTDIKNELAEDTPVVLKLVLNVWKHLLLELRQRPSNVLLCVQTILYMKTNTKTCLTKLHHIAISLHSL